MTDGAARVNPRVRFLNACNQSELDALFHLISSRTHNWNRCEPHRAAIEGLCALIVRDNSTGDILVETHRGQWWMDWVECCLFFPKDAPTPLAPPNTDQMVQLGRCPIGVRSSIFNEWKGTSHVVKLFPYHIAFRQAHAGTLLPNDLGRGSLVSHYCDISGCTRRDHLALTARHVFGHVENMERQRCQGATLITFNGIIIKEVPCAHDEAGDFSQSCRKISVISLDHLQGLLMISSQPNAVILLPAPGGRPRVAP